MRQPPAEIDFTIGTLRRLVDMWMPIG